MHLRTVLLVACVACSSAEKTLSFSNWSDLEDLVSKVSDAISSRAKRDFPYNYDAEAQYSEAQYNEAAAQQYTPSVNSAVADERQDGAGTDIVFQFPQTSVPELIVNLAPFGSVGVLGYSIVRDIQLQGELDNIKRMIEDLEDAGIADLDTSAKSLCSTVNSLTSLQACTDAGACGDDVEAPMFGEKARDFLTKWSMVANPTC